MFFIRFCQAFDWTQMIHTLEGLGVPQKLIEFTKEHSQTKAFIEGKARNIFSVTTRVQKGDSLECYLI